MTPPVAARSPLWSFCVIHDLHLGSSGTAVWNNRMLFDRAEPLLAAALAQWRADPPDFALLLGDLTDAGDRESFGRLGERMRAAPCPLYPAVGNHDAVHHESRQWLSEALPPPATEQGWIAYDFVHRGLAFVVLDVAWVDADGREWPAYEAATRPVGMTVPHELLSWLERRLEACAPLPTVVCLHYPLIPLREERLRRGARDAGALHERERLLAVLRCHPHVRAVLAGHLHVAQVDRQCGIVHATGAALVEWPHAYRRFAVFADEVRVTTHSCADAATQAESLIPGHEWAAGTADEQSFTIPLTG